MLLVLAAAIGIHIVATTSIKTNVGILWGALTAGAIHFGYVSRLLWRNALVILVAGSVLAYAVASNEAAVATIERARIAWRSDSRYSRRAKICRYSAFERRETGNAKDFGDGPKTRWSGTASRRSGRASASLHTRVMSISLQLRLDRPDVFLRPLCLDVPPPLTARGTATSAIRGW